MRISDWSSDVCSSDLLELGRGEAARVGDDLDIDFVGQIFARRQRGAAPTRLIGATDTQPIDPGRRAQRAERVEPATAAAQRIERGGKLDRLGRGPIFR